MCGISGKLSFKGRLNKKIELPLIRKTVHNLQHRGPDDRGYYLDKNVWLASTRLSIIDLSPAGHQPMINRDGSLAIVFNGEIYNFREIRKRNLTGYKFRSGTDTETVLCLYEKFGINCLKYLRGMFSFAIWDKRKQELFIARDRIGKKPIKYFYNDKFFIFASELKAIINYPGIPKEIDLTAIYDFLKYQYVPYPKTGFKNIRKLPPAHYIVVGYDGKIKIERYWDLNFNHKLSLSEHEWMGRIDEKLKESVKVRLQSDVPLGIHLSGGIDSGLITAYASGLCKKKIRTFSIGFENSDFDELKYAQLIADKYRTEHHEIIIKPDLIGEMSKIIRQMEEPFADPSLLLTWYLMKESRKQITVALNGDGGDENFAGYRRYKFMQVFKLIKMFPGKDILGHISSFLYYGTHKQDFSRWKNIFYSDFDNPMHFYRQLVSQSYFPIRNIKSEIIEKTDSMRINRYLFDDIKNYLPGLLLPKSDLLSMAHSLEVRSPFLDQELMELTAKMPDELKLKGFNSKYLLKKMAEKYLPEDIIYRKKQGFTPPLALWFRMELRDYLYSNLLQKSFVKRNIISQNSIEKMLRDHMDYKSDNSYSLWTLLCLKLWLNEWFD